MLRHYSIDHEIGNCIRNVFKLLNIIYYYLEAEVEKWINARCSSFKLSCIRDIERNKRYVHLLMFDKLKDKINEFFADRSNKIENEIAC